MPSIKRGLNYLLHNRLQFCDSIVKNFCQFLPDKIYLSLRYRCSLGHWINWKNPRTFTEKLQWLKIYDFKTEYTRLVDKYAVKDYVASKIGKEYIIPTIGVWDKVEDIAWDTLPDQFVLKATHAGGGNGVVICDDKSVFNKETAIQKLRYSLAHNLGYLYREHPYDNVPRKIIAEKFLKQSGEELKDYKFFCFNGKVHFFKIDFGRFVEHHANYYDPQGNILPFGEQGLEPDFNRIEKIPDNLDEMISIAERLSSEFKFLRVDLYNVSGKIYFGELTFYPAGGLLPYVPNEWDYRIGQNLKL